MENRKTLNNRLYAFTSIPSAILACLYVFSTVSFIVYTLTDGKSFYKDSFEMMSVLYSSSAITIGYFLIYAVLAVGFFLLYYFIEKDKSIKFPVLLLKIAAIYTAVFKLFNQLMGVAVNIISDLKSDAYHPNITSTYYVVPWSLVQVIFDAVVFILLFKFVSMIEKNTYNKNICVLFVVFSGFTALCKFINLFEVLPNSLYQWLLYISLEALYVLFTIIGIQYIKQNKA